MTEVYRVSIPEALADYLQKVCYEVQGYQVLCAHIVERNFTDVYQRFICEFRHANCEYRIMLEELRSTYVPAELQTERYMMRVEYSSPQIIVYDTHREGMDNADQ